jgi:uroporphyrinogen-III decarboxylase
MNRRMNSKERIQAALNKEEVDRIPFTPLLTPYALAGFDETVPHNISDLMEYLGMDVFMRHIDALDSIQTFSRGDIESLYYFENGNMISGFKTALGTITSCSQFAPKAPDMPYIVKHLVETTEDLKIFKYILENSSYRYDELYKEYDYERKAIGERGEISCSFGFSPIQEFLEVNSGIETTYNLLVDEPELLEEVFSLMHKRNLAFLKELVKTPVEYFFSYENTGTTTLSPAIYTDYCTPVLDEYADIIHDNDKKYFIHMCGHLQGLKEEIQENRFDGVFDIAPAPTGNMELWEARESFGDKIVSGGIDCTTFAMGSPDETYRKCAELVEKVKPYRGVLIGSGDSMPMGTTIENIRACVRAIDDAGCY